MIAQDLVTAARAETKEHVEHNYADPITLREAACLAKMSVPQFVRLFKKVAGMSFVSYLTHVRLSRSVRLLKESCLTIAEVAYRVGFSDQSYFDRRFKAAFGQIPRDFRLLHKAPCRTSNGLKADHLSQHPPSTNWRFRKRVASQVRKSNQEG